jgi:hypothetical protein
LKVYGAGEWLQENTVPVRADLGVSCIWMPIPTRSSLRYFRNKTSMIHLKFSLY